MLQVVEIVLSGAKVEDARVELKTIWPTDHARAARQIAGLANASGGSDVIWVVGVDEDAHEVRTPQPVELQNWWGAVRRRFAEVAPEMPSLVVPVSPQQSVTALKFDTSRTPYLVTTDGLRGVDREVPWREGNATRSAHRHEVLRTVVEAARIPHIEPVGAWIEFSEVAEHPDGWVAAEGDPDGVVQRIRVQGVLRAFVEATDAVVLPEHKWSCELWLGDAMTAMKMSAAGPEVTVGSSRVGTSITEPRGVIEYVSRSGLHVRGPDSIRLSVRAYLDPADRSLVDLADLCRVVVRFPLALGFGVAAAEYSLVPATLGAINYGPDRRFLGFSLDGSPTAAYL